MPAADLRVKPRKAAELVADHLRAEIVSGKIGTGENLPVERDLIEMYGVSRPTLREALRILETEGLLEVNRGVRGGARVLGPSLTLATHAFGMILQSQNTKLSDVQVARSIIEPPAARMVAERRSADDLRVLREIVDDERGLVGTPEFPFAAMRFHEALMSRCGNNTIDAFLQVLHDIHAGAATMFSRGRSTASGHHWVLDHHERLLAFVEAGDADGAEALWRRYWEPFTRADDTAVVDILRGRP